MKAPAMNVTIGSMCLSNPVMSASGTFGYGEEFNSFVNLHKLGGVVVKGISLKPRPGNPPPRIVETSSGMLNAIGLENVGLDKFLQEKIPFLKEMGTNVVVNILGNTIDEYCDLVSALNATEGVAAIEVNISCPNVKAGGVAFGTEPRMVEKITASLRKKTELPLIIKLSPNVTDITEMGKAAEAGGADAVSLINTLIGMAINIRTMRPKLANVIGGLSGPAIKPIALRMVWQTACAVSIPVIGIGGISSAEDAIEFLLAGATAIQVGTANFIQPNVTEVIIEGIAEYLQANKFGSITDLIGSLQSD